MRKKSLVVLAMAAAMVFGGAMTAHAEETQWYTELSVVRIAYGPRKRKHSTSGRLG